MADVAVENARSRLPERREIALGQHRQQEVLRHRRHRQRRDVRRASARTTRCATTPTASRARAAATIFFQWKMNLAYHDARYVDLYEETMYNALLGAVGPRRPELLLHEPARCAAQRAPWHTCPCCVGNIPRTLLMIPTWAYSQAAPTACTSTCSSAARSRRERRRHAARDGAGDRLPVERQGRDHGEPEDGEAVRVRVRVPDRKTQRAVHAARRGERLSVGSRQW